jgi:hypothetical protein
MKKIELNKKKKILSEIIKIKGNIIVSINGKKIENLTDDELYLISEKKLKEEKNLIEAKI